MTQPLVTVGRVVKPHGILGEVAVEVLSDVPGRLDVGVEVVLGGRSVTIAGSRPHQGRLLLRFDHVPDRTAAELLRGALIEAPAIDLDEADTYFAHELVGLPVIGEDGDDLGVVSGLIELPPAAGYDLLEVRRADGTTWLLPAVDDYVEVADTADGTEVLQLVDAPEGLVEGTPDVARPDVARPDVARPDVARPDEPSS